MPFCPTCRQEFESFAKRCFDCEVDLVAELKQETAPASVAIAVFDAPATDYIMRLLTQAGVAARMESGVARGLRAGASLVFVAAPYAQGVMSALGGDPSLEEVEAPPVKLDCPIVGAFRAAPRRASDDSIAQAPLLDEPVQMLVRRGDPVLPELLELVRRGAPKIREGALAAIAAFGAKGRERLLAEMPRWVKEVRADALYGAAKLLRDAKAPPTTWDFLTAISVDRAAKSDARCLALHLLARTEHPGFAPGILPLLDDADEFVREAADEALCNLLDDDHGFDPEADATARKRVVDAWRNAVAKRGLGS